MRSYNFLQSSKFEVCKNYMFVSEIEPLKIWRTLTFQPHKPKHFHLHLFLVTVLRLFFKSDEDVTWSLSGRYSSSSFRSLSLSATHKIDSLNFLTLWRNLTLQFRSSNSNATSTKLAGVKVIRERKKENNWGYIAKSHFFSKAVITTVCVHCMLPWENKKSLNASCS